LYLLPSVQRAETRPWAGSRFRRCSWGDSRLRLSSRAQLHGSLSQGSEL